MYAVLLLIDTDAPRANLKSNGPGSTDLSESTAVLEFVHCSAVPPNVLVTPVEC
jgi:hypothetical protein